MEKKRVICVQSLSRIWENIFTKIAVFYIGFVYKTSKVIKVGEVELLKSGNKEKFIIGFWHGDSYCFYPLFMGTKIYVITTINRRGDFISNMCEHFGYAPLRVPDESVGGNFLFKIRKTINGAEGVNLALALDGPLGPYHVPKDFALITARISKRKLLPLSIKVKRKIRIMKRWDQFMVPLPFNKIEFHIHEPIEVSNNDMDYLLKKITRVIEN